MLGLKWRSIWRRIKVYWGVFVAIAIYLGALATIYYLSNKGVDVDGKGE